MILIGFNTDNGVASLQFITVRNQVLECREVKTRETREKVLSSRLPSELLPPSPEREESGNQSKGPAFNFSIRNSFLIQAETERNKILKMPTNIST